MLGLLALAGGDYAEAVAADSAAAARVTAVASKLSLFIGRLLYRRFGLSSLHTPLAELATLPTSRGQTASPHLRSIVTFSILPVNRNGGL